MRTVGVFLTIMFLMPLGARESLGTVIQVPQNQTTIAAALGVASSGDVIAVRFDYDNVATSTIRMKAGVVIEPQSGVPTISSTADTAIAFDARSYSANTAIKGFNITGFSDVGVMVYQNTGSSTLTIENCVITGDGATALSRGIFNAAGSSGPLVIKGNTIQDVDYGIWAATAPSSWLIEDNIILSDYIGVLLDASGGTIRRNTLVNVPVGIEDDHNSDAVVEYNVITGCADYGVGCLGGLTSPATIRYNIFYDNNENFISGGTCYDSRVDNVTDDPEFCTSAYTVHVNSPCAPANNSWSVRLGAKGIGCASGDLTNSSTLSTTTVDNGTVLVVSDFRVPSTKTLTISAGLKLRFDGTDEANLGVDGSENELIVVGTLDVNGTSGSLVTLESSSGSPAEGDWYGVRIEDANVNMDYVTVKHAQYGVRVNGEYSNTSAINHCTFLSNQTYDLDIENNDSNGLFLDVTNNTFTVAGGSGIHINDNFTSGVVVTGNTLTCSSATVDGIYVNSTNAALDIVGNTITGASTGQGINLVPAAGFIRGNTISNCKYGIKVAGGDPVLGPEASQAGNTITNCGTAGILTTGSGVDPLIRFNTSTGNASGLRVDSSSNPDAGNGSDDGLNDFEGNSAYAIRNSTGNTIQAVGNWFGDCETLPSIYGSVNIDDNLCTDPTSRKLVSTEPVPGPAKGGPEFLARMANPGSGSTLFQVTSARKNSALTIRVFDVSGRLVRSLVGSTDAGGNGTLAWDGRDAGGQAVRNGIYLAQAIEGRELLGSVKLVVAR